VPLPEAHELGAVIFPDALLLHALRARRGRGQLLGRPLLSDILLANEDFPCCLLV
jgi:hypothetical protein